MQLLKKSTGVTTFLIKVIKKNKQIKLIIGCMWSMLVKGKKCHDVPNDFSTAVNSVNALPSYSRAETPELTERARVICLCKSLKLQKVKLIRALF